MELGPGEPAAGPWQIQPLETFARSVAEAAGTPPGRPRIIAVDGRGGGGKTALAERLARAMPPSAIIHSDDVAWAHARFDWADPMIDGVLQPLHSGDAVHYRPPGWDKDNREGHLDVPAGRSTVLMEGVGVSRRALTPHIDVAIWVQSDFAEAKRRGMTRDIADLGRTESEALRQWDEWEAEEVPFLVDDQPWARAHFIVGTASSLPHNAETEVVVSRPASS